MMVRVLSALRGNSCLPLPLEPDDFREDSSLPVCDEGLFEFSYLFLVLFSRKIANTISNSMIRLLISIAEPGGTSPDADSLALLELSWYKY